jgi:sarcosine oxidase
MPTKDAVVVGAGVMGAWTARWLQRRGVSVTLIDQYTPGSSLASSGGETRVTRSAHGSDDHYPGWQRHALGQWRELEQAAHRRLMVDTGVLWLAHSDHGFEAESFDVLTRLRIPVERLANAEVAKRWPQIGGDDLEWALFEPEGGALMAREGVAAVVDLFAAEGGTVVHDRVLPPDHTDAAEGRLRRLHTSDGSGLGAQTFVFAAGPWLPKLLIGLLDDVLAVTRQEYVYLATPPGDSSFDARHLPTWVDYDRAFYGIPSIAGRGLKIAPDYAGPPVDPDRQERRISDGVVDLVRAFAHVRFPGIADQPVAEGRVCQYEATPDTNFIIDRHPAWENAWMVGGGSGHGFKHGPTIGEYVSALVIGDEAAAAQLAPPDDRFALRPRDRVAGMRTSGAISELPGSAGLA